MNYRALFLDRDGTIVHRYHHPHKIEHVRLIDGIGAALLPFQAAGWKLMIISNQHAVALGLLTEHTLHQMHDTLLAWLAADGVQIDGVYTCIHAKSDGCACRKPAPGMILAAAKEHDVDLSRSWMVGDFRSDVAAGNRAGCHTALVDYGDTPSAYPDDTPTLVAATTLDVLRAIAAREIAP